MAEPGRQADELVELVAADGRVIEVVTRQTMRARAGARHRCTYVVVMRTSGTVVVHQRAPWKDVAPSAWDIAFGGVCGVGEGWPESAARELAEEAGLSDVPLIDLGQGTWTDGHAALIGRVHLARTDAPLRPADGEVVALDEVAVDDLDSWMAAHDVVADSPAVVLPLLRANLGAHDPHDEEHHGREGR